MNLLYYFKYRPACSSVHSHVETLLGGFRYLNKITTFAKTALHDGGKAVHLIVFPVVWVVTMCRLQCRQSDGALNMTNIVSLEAAYPKLSLQAPRLQFHEAA